MSTQSRPIPTRVDVCDLCDEILPKGEPGEVGSLTTGWLAHPVKMPQTKRAWLLWPPGARKRKAKVWNDSALRERRYDFHAECILRLVEEAIAKQAAPQDGTEGGGE